MTNRAYRAMDFIGDDLIARAEMSFGATSRRPAAVWTKGIAVAASVGLIASGVYVGMRYWNGTENVGTPSPSLNAGGGSQAPAGQTTEPGASTAPIQTTIGSMPDVPTIADGTSVYLSFEDVYFYHKGQSFAKVTIDEFSEVYQNKVDGTYFIFVKATIVEDYFGTLESGAQITLCMDLIKYYDENNEHEPVYMDAQVLKDFLSKFDYFFMYLGPKRKEYFYPLDKTELLSEESYYQPFDRYESLPISDGKLDLTSLREFWYENEIDYMDEGYFSDTKFWKYVQDGMDESVFAEYIRENKERQIQKSS